MTPAYASQTYLLFGILAAILVFASTVGWVLKQRSGPQPSSVIVNLNSRINAWWVMMSLLAVVIVLGKGAFIVLFALI